METTAEATVARRAEATVARRLDRIERLINEIKAIAERASATLDASLKTE